MKRLATILLLVAYSALGQFQTINPSTSSSGGGVSVDSGGGAITNVTFTSYTTYSLASGTNTITATRAGDSNNGSNAPLRLIAKTNITIQGLGWNSVVFSPTLGNFAYLAHCDGITFSDMAFVGTRAAYAANPSTNGLFGCISVFGTNRNLRFERVLFKNHMDHCFFGSLFHNTDYVTFKDCVFEDNGSTNNPTDGAPDGTAIHVIGSHYKIINNTFRRCRIGVEFEGVDSGSVPSFSGFLIEGNTFVEPLMQCIVEYGVTLGKYNDLTIKDNFFYYDQTANKVWGGQAVGILMDAANYVKVANNVFNNCDTAIQASAVYRDMSGWSITDNTICTNSILAAGNGIVIGSSGGKTFDGATISRNYFTNCNWWGINLLGATRCIVEGNIFDRVGSGGAFGFPISVIPSSGGSVTTSNTIRLNKFIRTTGASIACIEVQSGVSHTRIFDNEFSTSPPWSDAGTGTIFGDNWGGTNLMSHVVYTNAYVNPGGTNVHWNVAGPRVQFLEVTNTCLVQITNYSAINTSYRAKLFLINNKATNMGVFASAAGVRVLGTDGLLLAGAVAGAHNSLTNGRCMELDCEYFGTNLVVTVTHQR